MRSSERARGVRTAVTGHVLGALVGASAIATPAIARGANAESPTETRSEEPIAGLGRPPPSAGTPTRASDGTPAVVNPDSGNTPKPAAPAAPPSFYVAAFVATTLVYRPYGGGPVQGPQGDASPIVGFGYYVTEQIALELDLGATFAAGGYVATSLTPGVVWAFHPNVYAAGRVIVPVHPDLNAVLYPGVGGTYAFGAFSPFVEMNLLSTVGRGEPDLGLGGSAGGLYSF